VQDLKRSLMTDMQRHKWTTLNSLDQWNY